MNRKIVFSILLFLCAYSANLNAQFRVGPTGGFNVNRQVVKSNTYRYDGLFKSRMGYHFGILSDLVITKNISLQSELLYTHKGGYYKTERQDITEEYQSDLGYLELPAVMTYKIDLHNAYAFVGAGPYLSKLLFSKHTYNSNGFNIENGKLRVGTNTETDQIKPWDAGIKLKAGFELKKGMYVCTFYDLSTSDINPQFIITRNKSFGIQLAYIFSVTEEDRYNRFENFYEF